MSVHSQVESGRVQLLLVWLPPPIAAKPVISKSGSPGLASEVVNPGIPSAVPAPKSVDVIKTAEKAAPPADPDDLDVLALFKEDGGAAMRDTVRMEVSETIATRREALTEQEQAAPAAPPSSAADDESHIRQRPAPRPQQHKDGGEAAANALRQFLKGR